MAPKSKRWPRENFELVAHCARCGLLEASDIPAEHFRRWVRCPKDREEDKIHHAAVIRKDSGESWLRVEQFLLNWEFRWGLKERLTNLNPIFDELWVYMTSVTVSLAILLVASCNTSSMVWHVLCGFIAALIVADILLVNTSIAFVSRLPVNPLRSVWLIAVVMAEITLAFAVLFVVLEPTFERSVGSGFKLEGPHTALYYSFTTLINLGVDDVTNSAKRPSSQLLVAAEAFVGLYFIAIVLATIAGWLNDPPQTMGADQAGRSSPAHLRRSPSRSIGEMVAPGYVGCYVLPRSADVRE